jgi:hypothetical protein
VRPAPDVTVLTGTGAGDVFHLRVAGTTSPPRSVIVTFARLHEPLDRPSPAGAPVRVRGRGRSLARRPAATVAAAVAALLLTGAIAQASAPSNDSYLAAMPIVGPQYRDTVDTTEAGSQTNLFDPAVAGRPGGSAQDEPLSCAGQAYDKTVWFDLDPQTTGGARISASGYDAVVAAFEYDPTTGAITRPLGCSNASSGPTESLHLAAPKIQQGHHYAIQVGGAVVDGVAQSGTLNFALDFLADRDGDGIGDTQDGCPDVPGPRDGCPRQLPGTPALSYAGLRIVLLRWPGLPRGTEVRAQCSRCGARRLTQTVRVKRDGVARLTSFNGARARSRAVVRVAARLRGTAAGPGRFGAVGKSATYRFGSGRGYWQIGCLLPGSWNQAMACPS